MRRSFMLLNSLITRIEGLDEEEIREWDALHTGFPHRPGTYVAWLHSEYRGMSDTAQQVVDCAVARHPVHLADKIKEKGIFK